MCTVAIKYWFEVYINKQHLKAKNSEAGKGK
jgi:hypothetical protein